MNSQFTIPKPCHENWNAMTPDEQGRFCSLCSKSVTDFTQMSNDEIIIYLKVNKDTKVCGRFRNDQLKEKASVSIPKKILYSQTKFINIFLLALLVTMGSTFISCENIMGKATVEEDQEIVEIPAVSKDTTHHLLGEVSYDNDTLPPPPLEQQKAPNNQIPKSTNN